MTSRRDALAGLGLYTASRPRALAAQRAAWWLVSAFGPDALPGRARELNMPFDGDVTGALMAEWELEVGAFDSWAAHLRRPMARSGIALLLIRDGSPVGFVKLRRDTATALSTEHAALVALSGARDLAFTAPLPIAQGSVADWHYLLMSALPAGIHRPAPKVQVDVILSELAAALSNALPKPAAVKPHWEPMHGDFTPWNLRSAGLGRPVLMDWEEATWGPPRADALWFEATRRKAQLRIETTGSSYTDEARAFWVDRLSRVVTPGDDTVQAYTLGLLRDGVL